MLSLENISVFRDNWVLRNIELTVGKNDLIGVIGTSGAGKTTLLKVMARLLDVAEGKVTLDGERLLGPTEKLVPGYEEVQLVNQDFALDSFHTVAENIKEKILHLPKPDQLALIEELLELLEIKHLENRQARHLSGGEQQRLSIARALACEPRFLLLDEPFVHLDQMLRLKIMHYLSELNAIRGTGIVLVSHDASEMMGFVNKVVHLKNGTVERTCSTKEMYFQPTTMDQALLMGPMNQVKVGEKMVMFRPSEFDPTGNETALTFERAFETGLIVFNYFKTNLNESVLLTSSKTLRDLTAISIKKTI